MRCARPAAYTACHPQSGSLRWASRKRSHVMSTSKNPQERLARRRQANVAGGRKRRQEVLLTQTESEELRRLADAQKVSVPRLLAILTTAGEKVSAIRLRRRCV